MNRKESLRSPRFIGACVLAIVLLAAVIALGMQVADRNAEIAELQGRLESSQTAIEALEQQTAALQTELEQMNVQLEALQDQSAGKDDGDAQPSAAVKPQTQAKPAGTTADKPASEYVSKDAVKENLIYDLYIDPKHADRYEITAFRLDTSSDPAIYHVTLEQTDVGDDIHKTKYLYEINAKTGLIRDRHYYYYNNWEEEAQLGRFSENDPDDGEPRPWNKCWELGCRPGYWGPQQLFYDDIPIVTIEEQNQ